VTTDLRSTFQFYKSEILTHFNELPKAHACILSVLGFINLRCIQVHCVTTKEGALTVIWNMRRTCKLQYYELTDIQI
jgi:hypothetical protein